MGTSHSLPDSTAQATENNFLFSDWEMPERYPNEAAAPFDGKIIARMPDLGTDGFEKNMKTSKFPPFWGKMGATVLFLQRKPRPQYFLRIATLGCIILLVGIAILFFDRESKPTAPGTDIIKNIVLEDIEKVSNPVPPAKKETALDTASRLVTASQPAGNTVSSTIPVAPAESVAVVPNTAVNLPTGYTESVLNRPAGDPYSPFGVVPKQPENPLGVPDKTFPAPETPTDIVTMSPMIDMTATMPVSPYEVSVPHHEQPLVAQSSMPVRMPVDPFLQQSNAGAPGMMPVVGRVDNPPFPPQTQSRSAAGTQYPTQYYIPEYAPQSVVQGIHPPYSRQHNPYTDTSQSMPIPSGVSTLPPQGQSAGQYNIPHNTTGQRVPSEFYNSPPMGGRVY